jgi:cytochrome c oxidase assembly protein Cox11
MTFACSIAAILLLTVVCMIGIAWAAVCYYYWGAQSKQSRDLHIAP